MDEKKEFSMADGLIILIWLPLSFALMYALAFMLADGAGFADRMMFTYYVVVAWMQVVTLTSLDVFYLGLGLGSLFVGSACVSGFKRYEKAKVNIERQSLELDREEDKRQMKVDLALEAIDLFNDAKVALELVRSPLILKEEIEELDAVDANSELGKKFKKDNAAAVVLLRLEECLEIFASLKTLSPTFLALFDDKTPFDEFAAIVADVKASALAMLDGSSAKTNAKIIIQASEDDEISKKINEAVSKIEEICVAVIKG
ncbi:MAG: hypothetical protein GY804_06145 [Alphaproteobacteria bacterium]|nr:hypothetical protein [Alphaproteobacteria bacterium]